MIVLELAKVAAVVLAALLLSAMIVVGPLIGLNDLLDEGDAGSRARRPGSVIPPVPDVVQAARVRTHRLATQQTRLSGGGVRPRAAAGVGRVMS